MNNNFPNGYTSYNGYPVNDNAGTPVPEQKSAYEQQLQYNTPPQYPYMQPVPELNKGTDILGILSVVFFSGFGTTIAELTYAKDSVSFVSSVIDVEKMKAEYVIADLQTCFYPFEALKNNFEKSGFAFTEKRLSDESQDFERVLSENGKTILHVTRKASEIDLVNELRQYKYHINLGSE